jgi:hypothetical protein
MGPRGTFNIPTTALADLIAKIKKSDLKFTGEHTGLRVVKTFLEKKEQSMKTHTSQF